ncbi:ATP-dependent DNA helicase Q1-like [Homarus americanus]|uniref:ATP-dependent DNA helicase Q1-like n=1 Tax=Homarus americanus TaxID=6706 RepID=UPI001C43C15D|nr:ATP-dependent DNA helicase Q1-like [Homarus americanus]
MGDCEITDSTCNIKDPETSLKQVEQELRNVTRELQILQGRKQKLEAKKEKLIYAIQQQKSAHLARNDWERQDFSWSKELENVQKSVFKIPALREHQLPTINATLSGVDCILIMPTGGGKSLCFQLPALVSKGITLVVSPLVSLMEDQMMGLKARGINARMLCASSTKEEVNGVHGDMISASSGLKLLYVTPEKLAKSKRFMTKLQKMHQMGRFARLAIDEVHCCSQWGHDFRPDFKYLGIMRKMFPGTPILGLTATATSRVIQDVQKILNIGGCLVLKASFNRPNLFYEVRPKPSVQAECMSQLQHLLEREFKGQSGIIYTMTIKDAVELVKELRSKNLRVAPYHAQLEADVRSKVHRKWVENEYQAVVATIAFGMGIDKPDVRFVIHHCISKSMENFYQESGRAGRDAKPAKCIVFWRFADLARQSTMVFTEQTGLENLYGLISYCLDSHRCRRNMIAEHFDERWETADCQGMCDHCKAPREVKNLDIAKYGEHILMILANAACVDQRLTGQKLVDLFLGKGPAKMRVQEATVTGVTRDRAENIIAFLLIDGFLKEDFHFTPYSTISYIVPGPKAGAGIPPSPLIVGGIRKLSSFSEESAESDKITLATKQNHSVTSNEANKGTKRKGGSKPTTNNSDQYTHSSNKGTGGKDHPQSRKSGIKTVTIVTSSSNYTDSDTDSKLNRKCYKREEYNNDGGSKSQVEINSRYNSEDEKKTLEKKASSLLTCHDNENYLSTDSDQPTSSKRRKFITIDSSDDDLDD